MTKPRRPELARLIHQLKLLQTDMLELEASALDGCRHVHPVHRASAKNLLHYLALCRHDIRKLQSELAALGLSSLGRTEPHVLSALTAVLNLLAKLAGSEEVLISLLSGAGNRNVAPSRDCIWEQDISRSNQSLP